MHTCPEQPADTFISLSVLVLNTHCCLISYVENLHSKLRQDYGPFFCHALCKELASKSKSPVSAGSYPTAAGSLKFFTQKEFLTPKLFPGALQYGNCLKERKQQEQLKEQHCIWSQSMF